jgi:NO-binding membrane sensor protein with MHYT domain
MPDTSSRDWRLTAIAVIAVLAAAIAVLQRTAAAPFPHGNDDFLGGLAVGAGIAAVFAYIGTRA